MVSGVLRSGDLLECHSGRRRCPEIHRPQTGEQRNRGIKNSMVTVQRREACTLISSYSWQYQVVSSGSQSGLPLAPRDELLLRKEYMKEAEGMSLRPVSWRHMEKLEGRK